MPPSARHPLVALALLFAFLGHTIRAQGYTVFPEPVRDEAPPPSAPPPETRSPEPPAPRFGAPGESVITGASSVGLHWGQWSGSAASSFSAFVSPGFDYFVAQNVSVGIDVSVAYSDFKGYGVDSSLVETKSTTFSGGPRVGLNIPLGDTFSWYPLLTVAFETQRISETLVAGRSLSISGSALGYPSTTRAGPWVGVFLPILFHPAPHLFLGAGPGAFHEFGDAQGGPDVGGERTTIGGRFILGGWWGGVSPTGTSGPPAAPENQRRFGDAHELVVSGAASAYVYSTTYAGSGASTTTVGFEPGFDYFVADHVSLGAALSVFHGSTSGTDATTRAAVTSSDSSASIAGRVGFDVPITRSLSFYPRFDVEIGADAYDEKSGAGENSQTSSVVRVGVFAPLLVHPASHVFAGFGPSGGYDLSRLVDPSHTQNRNTSLGAGFVVGGWM